MPTFVTTRLKLTLWYVLISYLLLAVFTVAVVVAEHQAFGTVVQLVQSHVRGVVFNVYLQDQITQFETHFTEWLIGFDIVILTLSAGASYFLSGLTLAPIEWSLADQERFAADASHELRTPLSTISMEIEAHRRTHQRLDQETDALLRSIQSETERMSGMVRGLLSLVHADKPSHLGQVNISQMIGLVLEMVQSQVEVKQILVEQDLDREVSIAGVADEVKQIMLILIDNAIKYTAKNGRIKLELKQIQDRAQLLVFNTHPGIPDHDLPRLFERFYRSDESEVEGSGLGLAIARSLVEKMGGSIAIASETGAGVTLRILWPTS